MVTAVTEPAMGRVSSRGEAMTCIVNVKLSGSDNRARILKWGITASSTNSPEVAVESAARKLCAKTGRDESKFELQRVSGAVGLETWLIKFPDTP